MIRLVWDAVRGRRAQALTVLVLTGLAVGIATAAPWYVFASGEHLTEQYVANATPSQRILHLTGERATADSIGRRDVAAADIVKIAEQAVGTAHEPPITSIGYEGSAFFESSAKGWAVARDGACEHSVIDGACPAKPGDIMISRDLGARFNVPVGGRIVMILGGGMATLDMHVTGYYRPSDPADLWWSGIWDHDSRVLDPFFTSTDTIRAVKQVPAVTTVDLILLPGAYTDGLGGRISSLKSPTDWQLGGSSSAGAIPGQVANALDEVSAGVVASTGRFVLLAWFALLVVVRHTVSDRRPDLALVKLRGVRRWRILTATTGQTVSVMLTGAVGGGALAWGVVRLLIGPVVYPAYRHESIVQSAMLFGGVLLAALALAWFSEVRSLRTDVVELLRTVPPRVRRRAVDIVELVAAFLLAVGIWQLSSVDFLRGGSATAALVPGLLAIAVGLLASRFVLWLAGAAGRVAMRGGKLAVALAGLAAKRRPTMRWVITLMVVAVAGLTTALGETVRASQAVTTRAEQQLGASRVLSVTAAGRGTLLQGVRQADPTGTRAMAVSYLPVDAGFTKTLLAVDTVRLANVADWRPEYGPVPQAPRDERSPEEPGVQSVQVPTAIRVGDGPLTLTAGYDTKPHASGQVFTVGTPTGGQAGDLGGGGPGGSEIVFGKPPKKLTRPTYVEVELLSSDGGQFRMAWGPLTAGTKDYQIDVQGCASGCRVEYLGLYALRGNAKVFPEWGTQVRLNALSQAGTPVLTAAQLGDRPRWSGAGLTTVLGPEIAGTPAGLSVTVPPGCEDDSTRGVCDLRVFQASPPLAAYVAGNVVRSGRNLGVELSARSGERSPVEIAGAPAVLPRLGRGGALVDLAAFDQVAGPTLADERFEVWLAPGADDALLQRLRDAGITVRSDQTTEQLAADLQQQGPGAVRRYQLAVFFLGVFIAAFALALAAAVDRRTRAAELIALRRQGLDRRTVRSVVLLDYGVPLVIAVVAGLAAGAAAAWLPLPAPAVFADGWHVLDPPDGLSWPQFGLAAGVVGAIMAATLVLIARRLTGSALRPENGR